MADFVSDHGTGPGIESIMIRHRVMGLGSWCGRNSVRLAISTSWRNRVTLHQAHDPVVSPRATGSTLVSRALTVGCQSISRGLRPHLGAGIQRSIPARFDRSKSPRDNAGCQYRTKPDAANHAQHGMWMDRRRPFPSSKTQRRPRFSFNAKFAKFAKLTKIDSMGPSARNCSNRP